MPELPPPPGRIPSNDPPLLFSDFAPKERALERVVENEDEEDDDEKEAETDHWKTSSSDHFMEHDDRPRRRRRRTCPSCCRMCCACTCLSVSLFLLVVLIIGGSMVTSVKSSLPLVNVANLRFQRMDFNVSSSSSSELVMSSDVITVLQLSNNNDKSVLYYSPMIAHVSSENIDLGRTKLEGFRQDPNDVKTLKMSTSVTKSRVYDVDATLLRNKVKNFDAVVDAFVSGKLGLDFWGMRIHLPVVIACQDVKQVDVIQGLKPKCHVRIFDQGH